MPDVIKCTTSPARILRSSLEQVENHPLYVKSTTSHSRRSNSKLVAIQFGHGGHRFVTPKIISTSEGSLRLCGIEANLPAILYGHNGRLIKTQEEYVLALSLASEVTKFLVHPEDHHLILPGVGSDNNGFIKAVEVPVQLRDHGSELLLAAHLTSCRNFQKVSQIFPGESVCHRSPGLDIQFYDKLEECGEGRIIPDGSACTRIEARFRSPRRLSEALGLADRGAHVVATLPFDDLHFCFRQVIAQSLIGTLADAPSSPPKHLRPATRSILALASDAVSFLAALSEQEKQLTRREFGKIRRQIFHELARLHPVSLVEILENRSADMLSEVEIPNLEAVHRRMKIAQGWPTEADPNIAEAFSTLLLLRKDNPAMRMRVGPQDQPF